MYRRGHDGSGDYNFDNPVMANFSDVSQDIVPSRAPQKPLHAQVVEDSSSQRGHSSRVAVRSPGFRSEAGNFSDVSQDIVPSRAPQKPLHAQVVEDSSERRHSSRVRSPGYRSEAGEFEKPRGFFISYWRLFWLVCLLFLLALIVVVLAAFLDIPQMTDSTRQQGTAPPTTLDPGIPYHHPRLPTHLVPTLYKLDLRVDPDREEFTGSVAITVTCEEDTEYIILHAAFLTIDPNQVTVSAESYNEPLEIKSQFYFDRYQYYVIEMEEELIESTDYRISIDGFQGQLKRDMTGLYISEYMDGHSKQWKVIASQFSPMFARKAFPCFDEPWMKAVFLVTIEHPETYTALCNTQVELDTRGILSSGWQRDTCKTTPKMSTYVLGFALLNSDYRSHQRTRPDGFEVRVWARSDVIDQMDWLLDIADRSLLFFESYFNQGEVILKSDHVALPTHLFAAMENWGLVTYSEKSALYDPQTPSMESEVNTAIIAAHECSHMWFGNLVTMKWWQDVWLKEGFATFFMYIALAELEPSWDILDITAVTVVQDALARDGMVTSHPLSSSDVNDVNEIFANFDKMAYNKGLSVLRMLSYMIGTATFNRGVRSYVDRYKYSSADTCDLWEEFTIATDRRLDVRHLMDTWTSQKGYPVVNVRRKTDEITGQNAAIIDQVYFVLKPKSAAIDYSESLYRYKWDILFSYVTTGNPNVETKWLYSNVTSVTFSLAGDRSDSWILGNVGLTGFYRVNYDVDNWNRIIRQLESDHTVFSPVSRAAVIDDAFALQRAGLLDTHIALAVTQYLTRETQYEPWYAAITALEYLSNRLYLSPVYESFLSYVRNLLIHIESSQQWTVNDGLDSVKTRYLRTLLLSAACKFGSATCIERAQSLFEDFIQRNVPVEADLALVVYSVGVSQGNADQWNRLWSYAQSAEPDEADTIQEALAASQIPWILERYMSWSINSSFMTLSAGSKVIGHVGQNVNSHSIALDYLDDRWGDILNIFGSIPSYIRRVLKATDLVNTRSGLQVLQNLQRKTPSDHPAYVELAKIIETVKINVEWTETYLDDIKSYLETI